MSKESGLGAAFYLSGYDISGDVTAMRAISGGPALTTGPTAIDKLAMERLGLLLSGQMGITTWWNTAANMSMQRLKTLPTADVLGTYVHKAGTLGTPAACIVAKQLNYDGNRAADGSFTFDTDLQSNGFGLEWATALTAGKRTDTTATASGTGVDFGTTANPTSSAFGAQFYLHVFSITGTSVTVKIQDSADNSTFADLTAGGFTAAAGVWSERIVTARNATVRQYLRVATTGTFSNAVFVVYAARNDTSVVF